MVVDVSSDVQVKAENIRYAQKFLMKWDIVVPSNFVTMYRLNLY